MAPIPIDDVDSQLKDIIQDLFEIQASVHGYLGSETQETLVHKIPRFAESLAGLSSIASTLPTQVPPEIIEYIDDGRNPDIYTREFVELVQKSNADLKGKSEAFAVFRDILAEDMTRAMPEKKGDIQRVQAGGPVQMNGQSSEVANKE